jgi:hypothetical protein
METSPSQRKQVNLNIALTKSSEAGKSGVQDSKLKNILLFILDSIYHLDKGAFEVLG